MPISPDAHTIQPKGNVPDQEDQVLNVAGTQSQETTGYSVQRPLLIHNSRLVHPLRSFRENTNPAITRGNTSESCQLSLRKYQYNYRLGLLTLTKDESAQTFSGKGCFF